MFSEDEVENVGPDLQEDNIVDSGEVNPGEEVDMFDPGEGTSSGNKSRSRTSQWRFENKILEAANHDPQAIAGAHQKVLPNKDAAYVPTKKESVIGLSVSNINLMASELTSIRQLEHLVRIHVMLAMMAGRGSSQHNSYCLMAWGFLKQIWQVRTYIQLNE